MHLTINDILDSMKYRNFKNRVTLSSRVLDGMYLVCGHAFGKGQGLGVGKEG